MRRECYKRWIVEIIKASATSPSKESPKRSKMKSSGTHWHSVQNSGILSVALGRTLQYWRDSIDIQQAKEATCLRPYQEFREWNLEIGIAAFLQISELRSLIKASFEVGRDRLLSTTCRARPIDILCPSTNVRFTSGVRCVYFKILSSSTSSTYCRFCSIQAHLHAKRWSAGQMHVALWELFQIDSCLAWKVQ